jgi:hypothetical protein
MNQGEAIRRPDYVYADLSRAGLGNCLFPWARAVLAAKQHDRPMLPSKWLRVRIGPYLRGDMDKRNYWQLFRAPSLGQLATRARLLATATLLDESGCVVRARRGPTVQVFRVIDEYFQPLYGQHEVIAEELRCIARPGVINPDDEGDFVAMHVRRGDFIRSRGDEPPGAVNLTTSITWFVEAASWLRSNGWDGEIRVFSDGTQEELAELVAQPGIRRQHSRNALDDLFCMTRGRLIIGSASSFCAWAAFLGDIPVALEYGRNPFLTGRLVHEVARWADEVAPALLTAVSDRR